MSTCCQSLTRKPDALLWCRVTARNDAKLLHCLKYDANHDIFLVVGNAATLGLQGSMCVCVCACVCVRVCVCVSVSLSLSRSLALSLSLWCLGLGSLVRAVVLQPSLHGRSMFWVSSIGNRAQDQGFRV